MPPEGQQSDKAQTSIDAAAVVSGRSNEGGRGRFRQMGKPNCSVEASVQQQRRGGGSKQQQQGVKIGTAGWWWAGRKWSGLPILLQALGQSICCWARTEEPGSHRLVVWSPVGRFRTQEGAARGRRAESGRLSPRLGSVCLHVQRSASAGELAGRGCEK